MANHLIFLTSFTYFYLPILLFNNYITKYLLVQITIMVENYKYNQYFPIYYILN